MLQVFSTAGLPRGRGFCYFQKAICQAVVRLEAHRRRFGEYDAEIQTNSLGPLELVRVRCDPVLIERTSRSIAADRTQWYFITLQLERNGIVSQRGRDALLQPGDFTLLDSTEPYCIRFDEPVQRLVVRVPRRELDLRLGKNIDPFAVRFSGDRGLGRVFSSMVQTLASDPESLDTFLGASAAAIALDLLAAAVLPAQKALEPDSCIAGSLLLLRSQAFIRTNLRNPELRPGFIAANMGISVRYLHKLFQPFGLSVSEWIRNERLRRCYAELADPKLKHRSVMDIAFSNGFNDAAHFSRCFARHFGVSPRSLRLNASLRSPSTRS